MLPPSTLASAPTQFLAQLRMGSLASLLLHKEQPGSPLSRAKEEGIAECKEGAAWGLLDTAHSCLL